MTPSERVGVQAADGANGRAELPALTSATLRPPLPKGPYLVAGIGRAGRAAASALGAAVGAEAILAWDSGTTRRTRRAQRQLEAAGIRTRLGAWDRHAHAWGRGANTLVKSPGISCDAPIVRQALERRIDVIDELELGWRLGRAPVLGVTGTNGKSTVAGLIVALLTASDRTVQLAGNTDFGPPLSKVASEPSDWIVCEVSSFQLEACPCLLPDIAVFTNLTPEHLSRHGTIERYGEVKRRLFARGEASAPVAVINMDDAFGRTLATDLSRRGSAVLGVGFGPGADYRVAEAAWDLRQARLLVSSPSGRVELDTLLPGAYNAHNAAVALAIADLLGVERSVAAQVLATHPGPPGRFEHVDEGQDYDVIIDFAHTPNGLEQFLLAARASMKTGGRLRTVFGLGRLGAAQTRAMGRVARLLSDELILTTSSYGGQPPLVALQHVLHGVRTVSGRRVEVVLDRRRAIKTALERSSAPDVVVIPGRGALTEMSADPRGVPQPFDDREVAREILRASVGAD
jgi:UDP-N-acetylmuramoyl-L-alanyl-D-glutamate--2,6-diaminopimelate ligase